jgi:hypothetical protein
MVAAMSFADVSLMADRRLSDKAGRGVILRVYFCYARADVDAPRL